VDDRLLAAEGGGVILPAFSRDDGAGRDSRGG